VSAAVFSRRRTLPEAAASKSKNLGHVDCLPRFGKCQISIRHARGAIFRIIGSYSAPGPHGFERTVTFAIDDDPAVIAERVRETMED
jgi:hypothetical protein